MACEYELTNILDPISCKCELSNIFDVNVTQDMLDVNVYESCSSDSSGGTSAALNELFGLPDSIPQLVIGSDTDIYSILQDIVPSIDIDISIEQAAEFTRQTQTIVGTDISIGKSVEQGNGSDLEKFFGVVEPKDCQWMTQDEVFAYLEQIMQTIDPELTASMAQSITKQTKQTQQS